MAAIELLPQNLPVQEPMKRNRLITIITTSVTVLALAGCTAVVRGDHHPAPSSSVVATSPTPRHLEHTNPEAATEAAFAQRIGQSILQLHQDDNGGWKYPSAIQDQHFQTDRDVGDASVGMGDLAMADRFPSDPRYLQGAEKIATWLTAVANKGDNGEIWWNDYVDPGDRSKHIYTSFDDGALGIGDFFWRLYKKTGNEQYKATALGTVKWTMSQADNVGSADQPAYRWLWDLSSQGQSQDSDNPPIYNMGMGMGVVGITNTLAEYYHRTKTSDPDFAKQCRQYAEGGVRFIQQVQSSVGTNGLPETGYAGWTGDTTLDSGYLSGAAGAAYMYLNLYHIFGDSTYLDHAKPLLSWLLDTKKGPMVQFTDGSTAWHIAIDPQDDNPSDIRDNAQYATGIEEGGAGIGYTLWQAFNITGDQKYLDAAKNAAKWLLRPEVVIKDGQGGYSWREDENPSSKFVHPNLDNGSAGIAMFFYSLYTTTHDKLYLDAANAGLKGLMNSAKQKGNIVYWEDTDNGKPFSMDTSWHWGLAGDGEAFTYISGGDLTIPGEQDALATSH